MGQAPIRKPKPHPVLRRIAYVVQDIETRNIWVLPSCRTTVTTEDENLDPNFASNIGILCAPVNAGIFITGTWIPCTRLARD